MATLMERAKQAVSVTDFIRSHKAYLDTVTKGDQDKLVLMKNNAPAAVLLNVDVFEALMDELEDMRIEAIAAARLARMNADTPLLSHDEVFDSLE